MNKESLRKIHFDLLRVLAMVLVVLFHYTTQFDNTVQSTDFIIFFSSKYSAFAVSLFLLMVGFFSYKPIHENKLTALDYLKKRLIRLLPTFWLCLIISSFVLTLSGTNTVSAKQFVLNALLINRFFGIPFVDGVYWYMLIMVIFTIITALALRVKETKYRIILLVLYDMVFVILGVINRFICPIPNLISFALFEYINKCFVGLLLAFLYNDDQTTNDITKLTSKLLIITLVLGEFLWIGFPKACVETASIILFVVIIYFGDYVVLKDRTTSIVCMLADESYFVYLIHQQIGFVIMKMLINSGINCNISVLITILVVGIMAATHYYLSQFMGTGLLSKQQ